MKWLTATVLQYVAGALLLACFALFARGCTLSTARDLAVAAQGKAEADRDAARTERDSWKSKTEDAQAANRAYDVIFEQQRLAAAEQQRLAEEAAETAAAAVAAAKRDEEKAEQQLTEFQRVFGKRPPDCDNALKSLDRVCPAWRY